ncbi:GNAT family protein [Paenibacillus chitinolyticus]|uniref:hypothetical protein n=1 Tax=Paenibacillus chitinolyticus TaxID=79263 RepID=UPI003670DB79
MIYELKKSEYHRLKPILLSGFQFPEIYAVVNLVNSGWIVADDPVNPTSAFVWAEGLKGFFLIGCENNISFLEDLNHFIDHELNERLQRDVNWVEVAGMHQGWDDVIKQSYHCRNVKQSIQLIYKWDDHQAVEAI